MTTTRSRSLTITTQGEDYRVHLDDNGVVSYAALPIGRIVEVSYGWKPGSLSGVTGRAVQLQRDAIQIVVDRYHRQVVQTRNALAS